MLTAILLAAGRSSRFGRNKLLEPLRGQPLICHSLKALLACAFDEVVVVLGHDESRVRAAIAEYPCHVVHNPNFESGMSSSILQGLEPIAAPSRGALIAHADMPLLRPSEIRALMEAFQREPDRIIAPSSAGRQANPVIIPRCYWPEVRRLRGDVGCKAILMRHSTQMRMVTLPSLGVLQDVDTPETLATVRRRLDRPLSTLTVLIRGAGELASAVAHCLTRCHLRVCMTELENPLAIRRRVCFSEAVYEATWSVRGITARTVESLDEIERCWTRGEVPLVVDPGATTLDLLCPDVLVDGVMAKRNTGIELTDAPLVIGLGPGFIAGEDVHVVIETNRGHHLSNIIESGSAEPDTGEPADVNGHKTDRVVKAPHAGHFFAAREIGDRINRGDSIGRVEATRVRSRIEGILRGIMRGGTQVAVGTKLADIDPRCRSEYCDEISDKARAISGSVLEAILIYYNL